MVLREGQKIGLATESLKMLSKNKTIQSREEETDGLDQIIWEISDKQALSLKLPAISKIDHV